MLRISLIGMNGCGKTVISKHLQRTYGIPTLSAGMYLRNKSIYPWVTKHVPEGYDISSGDLLENDNLVAIILEAVRRYGHEGFCFDGTPRRLGQARTLINTKEACPTHFIVINSDEEIVTERLKNRLVHPSSGRIYNTLTSPPIVPGHDDITGEPLVMRGDDSPEIIKRRVDIYHRETHPLLDFLCKEQERLGCYTITTIQDRINLQPAELTDLVDAAIA